MAGLDPAIHVFASDGRFRGKRKKTWMPGSSQVKPGHDERKLSKNTPKRITAVDNAMTPA
jgi:hypothetical protein